jgi:hypothetical protein
MAKVQCVYCGTAPAITVDHVPPRSFFGTPPPPGLITVPSCEACNRGFNVEDDYVRMVLATDEKARGVAGREQIIPSIIRYSQREGSKNTLREFYRTLGKSWHENPQSVITMAQHHVVDGRRMDAFARRMVRGLFFREKGHRVPDSYGVDVIHRLRVPELIDGPDGDFFSMVVMKLAESENRHERGETFAYSFLQSPNDDDQTWWTLEFYGTEEWLSRTVNPAL